ncbi:MAG: squalene--hopene cyclase, partial [Planctomycetaceae bacterium]
SFVTMSLAGKGLVDHPVVRRALSFLCNSVRVDGSWPIDTNLATWTTTLSINALQDDLPESLRPGLTEWLLGQQYQQVHPYTNADPGGWAWTDLPGGVPDADDTPGAVLALLELQRSIPASEAGPAAALSSPTSQAIQWQVSLQNRDGGFPTFCRGWGTLPFDRSSPDITAHCLRALAAHLATEFGGADSVADQNRLLWESEPVPPHLQPLINSLRKGLRFLQRSQRTNGSWVPLWFGNQLGHNDENPAYGTARVLMAYRDLGLLEEPESQRAARWLASIQHREQALSPATGENPSVFPAPTDSEPIPGPEASAGGWGGDIGIPPTVEETALAVEALLPFQEHRKNVLQGIRWLISRVEDGSISMPSPIGFYFARLWYFEGLYPLIFAASALRRAAGTVEPQSVTRQVPSG